MHDSSLSNIGKCVLAYVCVLKIKDDTKMTLPYTFQTSYTVCMCVCVFDLRSCYMDLTLIPSF